MDNHGCSYYWKLLLYWNQQPLFCFVRTNIMLLCGDCISIGNDSKKAKVISIVEVMHRMSNPKIIPNHKVRSLREIFNDKELKEAFKDFCMKSFFVEIFFFLEKVKKIVKITFHKLEEFKTEKKLQIGRAVIIYQKFLRPGSFLDLQLPKSVYAKIEEVCTDESKAMTEGTITSNFFTP